MLDQNERQDLLRIHHSTQGLNASEIEAIADVAVLREYSTGEKAITAGQGIRGLSLIISGMFEAVLHAAGTAKTLGFLGPNDQIGTFTIVQDEVPSADVIATEPSLVIEIGLEDAVRLISEQRVFARNLLKNASANMAQVALGRSIDPRPRRVTFLHVDSSTVTVSQQIQVRLCQLGERLGRVVDYPSTKAEVSQCPTLVIGENQAENTRVLVRRTLADWSELERIIFDLDNQQRELDAKGLRGILAFTQCVYLLVQPKTAERVVPEVRRLLDETAEWSRKLNLIWVLKDQHDVSPYLPDLESLCNRVFKVKLSGSQDSLQHSIQPGIERIVHDLRGIRIGLALAGGAAKGMCHLGVLKALEEHGITFDAIAGTSVGAMMGASYCAGYSPDDAVRRFTKALTPKGIFRFLGDKFFMVYQYRTKSWDRMLRPHFFDWKLEQLLVPLTTIAADLVLAEEFIRETGDTVTGILESINLGVVSVPICRDGKVLVDGGYLNNVPADTLVRQGADFVISVDISQSIKKQVGKNTPEMQTEQMKPPTMGQVLTRIREVAQKNLSVMGAAHADFVIAPNVEHVDLADFKSTPEIAEIGYREALSVIPQLKEKLNKLDPELFPLA